MRKKLLFMLVLLPALIFAQGTQDFETQTALTTQYADSNFTENGITYTYVHCRNAGFGTNEDNSITGKGIMLRRPNEPSSLAFTIPNGIGTLTFDARKAYTAGNNNRQLEVLVNETSVWTSPTFGASGKDTTVHPFTVPIDEQGSTTVKIQLIGPNGNKHVTIDNIEWTAYGSTPPPPTPTVTIPTPSLNFTQVAGTPSDVQTFTVTGANLTEDITVNASSPFEVSKDGITFSQSVTLEPTSGSVNATVHVRANAPSTATPGIVPSTITATSETAEDNIGVEVNISAPPLCMLDPMNIAYDITCHSNGTADPSDDYIIFKLNPVGVNLGDQYTISVLSSSIVGSATGIYGTPTTFQLATGSAGAGNVDVTITDATNSSCTQTVTIIDPGNGCFSSTPKIISSVTGINFGNVIIGSTSADQTFTIEGESLEGDIELTLTGTDFKMSETGGMNFTETSSITLSENSGSVASKTIYVRASPSSLGNLTGTITATSTNATDKTVSLSVNGIPLPPQLTISTTTLSGITNVTGSISESSATFTVSGNNLTADVIITAPTNFIVSLTDVATNFTSFVTIPFGSGTVSSTTVYVRSNATTANANLSGTINITSTGVITQAVAVSGSSTAPLPQITVTPSTFNDFDHVVGTPSSSQQMNVGGNNLTANITVSASANFEVSVDDATFSASVTIPHISGTVNTTVVYIRARATSIGNPFTGTITVATTNATDELRSVSGTATINYVPQLITDINQIDADGKGIHLGEYIELNGVVHCSNFHNSGYRFIIIDQSGKGFYVFATSPKNGYFPPTHGDSLKLKGKIGQFRGLLQIEVDEVELLKQDAETVAPELVTTLDETTESQYIQMKRVRLVTPIPTFTAGSDSNVDITDGTNTFSLRLLMANGLAGSDAPQGWFHITSAVGTQFASSNTTPPFLDGYQIIPCGIGSIVNCTFTNAPINEGDVTMKINDVVTFTSNGDAGEWVSSNPAVVSIDPITGEAKAIKDGSIEIYHIVSVCDLDTQKIVVTVPKPDDNNTPNPPVSINDNELAQSISLFPNPVENQLTINQELGTTNVKFKITDINGKVIVEQTSLNISTQIDTQHWNKGIYFVSFKDDNNNSCVFKIVK